MLTITIDSSGEPHPSPHYVGRPVRWGPACCSGREAPVAGLQDRSSSQASATPLAPLNGPPDHRGKLRSCTIRANTAPASIASCANASLNTSLGTIAVYSPGKPLALSTDGFHGQKWRCQHFLRYRRRSLCLLLHHPQGLPQFRCRRPFPLSHANNQNARADPPAENPTKVTQNDSLLVSETGNSKSFES